MKHLINIILILGASSVFADSVTVLKCNNLPTDYFPGVKSIQVIDNYDTRYRINTVTYNDGSNKAHGSSYMGEKKDKTHHAHVLNLESVPAKNHTYDFNINGITLRLRADGIERDSVKGNWFVDPLGDYGVNVVNLDCK